MATTRTKEEALPDRAAAARHATDVLDKEAHSRMLESKANILRGRVQRAGGDEKSLAEATKSLKKAEDELAELREQVPALDPEGTKAPFADRKGNLAANAEVAAAGGIGVDASNTKTGTMEPAQTADEAGEFDETMVVGVSGLGGRAETPGGIPLASAEDTSSPALSRIDNKEEEAAAARSGRKGGRKRGEED